MIGQTIAHYTVTGRIGAGGMGEVYRATDTKLGRDVALKVLPPAFAADPQRMQRFQREAQLLASLNHPHIATIHGLEEGGGIRALVMELVEGPTLAERIAQGALPLEETLLIARQIADALEYAHDRGIIHRDLKPANIKLTTDGKVKVLDFGLAKAMADDLATGSASMDFSPTLSMAATRAGIILGTAAYMAPEQAKGKPVDRRADIWSFGIVVFEMLTGGRAFQGEDPTEILASVIKTEPDWDALPATTPAHIRKLLRRCLLKDHRQRLRDIGEARIQIEEVLAGALGGTAVISAVSALPQPRWRGALPWVVAGVLGAALLLVWAPWKPAALPPEPLRLSTEIGAIGSLDANGVWISLSPDGTLLAFTARKPGDQARLLYLRRLNQLQATPLAGTDGAYNPFFSPDGQQIGFFAGDNKLKKISVTGGAAVTLCEATQNRGGQWLEDGTIIFAASNTPILRVNAEGGQPQPLTTLDPGETTHRWPHALPAGRGILFTAHRAGGNFDEAKIAVVSPSGQKKTILQGGYSPRFLPSGHLAYLHAGTLFVAPFDADKLETTGPAVPVIEKVVTNVGTASAQFAFSPSGLVAYVMGEGTGIESSLLWLDRAGKVQPLRKQDGLYLNPRFSPDGRRLALRIQEKEDDLWVYDLERDALSRLTFDSGADDRPQWTPDGSRIAFSSTAGGAPNLYWKRADGTGEVQRLTESASPQSATSWHPSGKFLAFSEQNPQTDNDLMVLPMEGNETAGWKPGKPTIFLSTPIAEYHPAFSPDGRWLAYAALDTGAPEIYVRPFPGPGGKWQVSTSGGQWPTWSRNGRELFFRSLGEERINFVRYSAVGDSFRADKPEVWSEVPFSPRGPHRNFDLHPDGRRFVILKAPASANEDKRDKVVFILNFFDELRRIAPPRKK